MAGRSNSGNMLAGHVDFFFIWNDRIVERTKEQKIHFGGFMAMDTFLIDEKKIKGLINFRKYLETTTELKLLDMPVVAAEAAALQGTMAARLLDLNSHEKGDEDRLLDVNEAAKKLGCKPQWLYHHSKSLPFIVRLGRKLRFSEKGIDKFIKEQRQISEGV
jgi:predicted DNA-binding transcriptional regulator AlpA